MDPACKIIEQPFTLKALLEFFAKLSTNTETVRNLEGKLKQELSQYGAHFSNHYFLMDVLKQTDRVYKVMVNNWDYGEYNTAIRSDCVEALFTMALLHLPNLFHHLQFLYYHFDDSEGAGSTVWLNQGFGPAHPNTELNKWLTDREPARYVGHMLPNRGFKVEDLNSTTGKAIWDELDFVHMNFPTLMKAIYKIRPFPPKSVGDMVSFLIGLCNVTGSYTDFKDSIWYFNNNERDKDQRNAIVFTELKVMLHPLLSDLNEFKSAGLSPINYEIYCLRSAHHLSTHISSLQTIIPELSVSLHRMKRYISHWGDSTSKDGISEHSRFHYRLKGWNWNRRKFTAAITKLIRRNGNLHKLELYLLGHIDDKHATGTPSMLNIYEDPESDGSVSNVVVGLLGAGAAVAVGGAAYAGNVFGIGDTVRGLFSRGAPVAASLSG